MRLPISLLFFVATGVVFILQLIPVVGIFLLFMLAAYWSVVLVNLGFLGVFVESISGRVSAGWLVLPILWFGGYFAAAINDHSQLNAVSAQFAAENANVRIPFDPSRHALVMSDSSGEWFVENYNLPVVYSRGSNSIYLATRIVKKKVCDEVRANSSMRSAGVNTFGLLEAKESAGPRNLVEGFCILRQPENPKVVQVTITVAEEETELNGLPVTFTNTNVRTPDGKSYGLRGGFASPLPWFPMPVLGCGLNSANPSWDCVAQFHRTRFTPLHDLDSKYHSDSVVLANAMGLVPDDFNNRQAADSGSALAAASQSQKRIVDAEVRKLDLVLNDVSVDIGSVPFNSLRGLAYITVPRLERIVEAVEKGVEIRGNGRNNAQQLFHLLEQAPPYEVSEFSGQIAALEEMDSWFVFRPVGDDLERIMEPPSEG